MKNRQALLIGVPEYQDSNIPNLPVVHRDIVNLENALKKSGFEVHTQGLDDKFYSGRGMLLEAFEKACLNTNKEDILLIYYSGHGFHYKGKDYLVPSDASLYYYYNLQEFLIPCDFLDTIIDQSKAETIVFFIDACREGIELGIKGIEIISWSKSQQRNVSRHHYLQVFSCSCGQYSYFTKDEQGFSLFSKALAEVLSPEHPALTLGDILNSTQNKLDKLIIDYNQKYNKKVEQKIYYLTESILGDDILSHIFLKNKSTVEVLLQCRNNTPQSLPDSCSVKLESFIFDYVTDIKTINPLIFFKNKLKKQGKYFIEDLGEGIVLEMVLIPRGTFIMGSPDTELERSTDEGPEHSVNVQSFFLGKYLITQAQWKAVALLPPISRSLDSDPSQSKGSDLPVDQVSWRDAIEFCLRLSKVTGRHYRLPSEAEWEYACRAGTNTPFHFGKTISSSLVNYNGNYTYRNGSKGKNYGQTTPVGYFQVANAFGLYDMHGNLWEWCADPWHDSYKSPSYKEAPSDGTVWEIGGDTMYRLLKGGSWREAPRYCRSAFRARRGPDERDDDLGFRVACTLTELI